MATAESSVQGRSLDTLADLLVRLGDIPLNRVRLHPPPGTATERDVIAARSGAQPRLCELIDGVLVEKAAGSREALLAGLILHYLWAYLDKHNLGVALGADGIISLWEGRVRIPDAAFFSWERIPGDEFPDQPIADIVPDLAIEVVSKNNTAAEIAFKLDEYFRAGVRRAWVMYPRMRTATVYTSAATAKPVGRNGKLLGADILPGFALSLSTLSARTKRRKRSQ